MPQLTSVYLEQEDNVLDYCRTVNFNRAGKAVGSFETVMEEANEIDGDACLTVINAKPNDISSDKLNLNQSMTMNDHFD